MKSRWRSPRWSAHDRVATRRLRGRGRIQPLVVAAMVALGACDNTDSSRDSNPSTSSPSSSSDQDATILTSDERSYVLLLSHRFASVTLVALAEQGDSGAVLLPHQVRELEKCQTMDGELFDEMFGLPPVSLSDAVIDVAGACRSLGVVKAGDRLATSDLEDLSAAVRQLTDTIDFLMSAPYAS